MTRYDSVFDEQVNRSYIMLEILILCYKIENYSNLLYVADIVINKDIALTIAKDYSGHQIKEEHPKENTDESWKSKQMRPEVLKYLAARNPLLGSVVEKMHCIESGVESGKSPTWATPLERELMSMETNRLATLYNDNVMLAVLQSLVERDKLWVWFDSAVQRNDWHACLDMLSFVPEKQFKTDPRFLTFRDYILEQLSSSAGTFRLYSKTVVFYVQ